MSSDRPETKYTELTEEETLADVVDIASARHRRDEDAESVDSTTLVEILPDEDSIEPKVYSRADISRILGLSPLTTKKLTDSLIEDYPDSFFTVNDDETGTLHCGYEMFNRVSGEQYPGADWVTPDDEAERTGQDPLRIKRAMTRIADITDVEQIRMHRVDTDEGPKPKLHMHQTIAEKIERKLEVEKEPELTGEDREKAEFENLTDDLKAGVSVEAQEFSQLVELFGPESATDLFYKLFPDAKKVPVGQVESFIADYIGEFVVDRGGLNFDFIESRLELLEENTFRDALADVIKKHCLSFYHGSHRDNPGEDDIDIIFTYLDDIRKQVAKIKSDDLVEVVSEVEEYFFDLVDDFERPDRVIEGLAEDRPFPDLNQRLNIKEISEKKRMLIADDPGLGKSASAILAKEKLGLDTAVIVAPSSVTAKNLWQTYLSDEPGSGYFKPGQAPSVLEVDGLKSLEGVKKGDYEYVIISQERLTDDYLEALRAMGYDMLIVDEAHKLKNMSEGKRAGVLVDLADELSGHDDTYTVILTATPAPNKVSDIAMELRLLYPEQFGEVSNKDLAKMIINGDVLELRSLLVPRMQMKRLEDSIYIPEIDEETEFIDISDEERDLLRLYIEDDENDFMTKVAICRKVLLNPATVDAFPRIVPTKAKWLNEKVDIAFNKEGDQKVLVFVNDFKSEVLSGESTLLDFLEIPEDVRVEWIHGDVDRGKKRVEIQQDFQHGDQRMLLIVSGLVADVGVDFSAADSVLIYNVGWTESEKKQEIGRAHRPGRTKSLKVRSSVAAGTIEAAMYSYAKRKDRAIKKLEIGVPLTEMEKEMLLAAEDEGVEASAAEVEPELGAYYFSAMQSLNRIIARTKEQGEAATRTMVKKDGDKYADIYQDLTGRSYQANMARLTGAVVENLISEGGRPNERRRIIDLGSGPEMLRRHVSDRLADQVVSLDINRHHFAGGTKKAVVGSVVTVPLASKSADILTMGLVLDGSKFLKTKRSSDPEALERLEVLKEMNRVLKPGGHAVITLVYSLDLTSEAEFNRLAKSMGMEVVSHYSGLVTTDNNDSRGRIITLKKVADCPQDIDELRLSIGDSRLSGLKFTKRPSRVKDPKKIDRAYRIGRKNRLVPVFNAFDQRVADEESEILSRMEQLSSEHGGIVNIPEDRILADGFSRVNNNGRYVLFRRLASTAGAVFLKDKKR